MRFRYAIIAMATVGATCLTGSGVALANSVPYHLCDTAQNHSNLCAFGAAEGEPVDMGSPGDASLFYIPAPGSGSGQIRLDGSSLCLQQDAAESNDIILEPCAGKAAEEWEPEAVTGGTAYVNEYTDDCLNDDYYTGVMNGAECNYGTDELWFS